MFVCAADECALVLWRRFIAAITPNNLTIETFELVGQPLTLLALGRSATLA